MWDIVDDDGVRVMRCPLPTGGRFDPQRVDVLFEELHNLIAADPHQPWLVNLEGFVLVNSRALALLVATARLVHEEGGDMVLVGVHHFVATVLKTTRIDRLVPIHELHCEAKAALLDRA